MRGKFLPVDKWGPNDQQTSHKHHKTGVPVSTTIEPDFHKGNGVIPNSWMDTFLNNSETFEEDNLIGEKELLTTVAPLDEDYIDLELLSNYSTEIYKPTEPSMFLINMLNPEIDLESKVESTLADSNFETNTISLEDDPDSIMNVDDVVIAHILDLTSTSQVTPSSDVTTASHMTKLGDGRKPKVSKTPEMPSDGISEIGQVPIEILQSQLMKMLDNLAHKYSNDSLFFA